VNVFVPAEIVRLVPQKYIRSRRVFPIALGPDHRRGRLFVATSEPQNLPMLDEITSLTGMAAQPVLVGDRDLDDVMTRHFGSAASAVAAVKVS
jgi:type IV pilus assembly protein PilB